MHLLPGAQANRDSQSGEGDEAMTTDAAERIYTMLCHRRDVYAVQQHSGAYLPSTMRMAWPGHEPGNALSLADVEAHLRGNVSIGTYVLDVDSSVRCVVFDLDTYERSALDFLCGEVERLIASTPGTPMPYACLMLEDSGGKGYHLWLPLDAPRSARDLRAWTKPVADAFAAQRASTYPEWPALEVFPKQDELADKGYGNLVKLPLGVHAKTAARSYVVERHGWASSILTLAPYPSNLVPVAPLPTVRERTSVSADDGPTRLPCINRLLADGAGAGIRDNAMYLFARYARACGLEQDMAQEWCERVNEGFSPPLSERQVTTKVRSAFGADAPHPSCKADWLRDYCPGGDGCYGEPGTGGSRRVDVNESYPLAMLPREERLRRIREAKEGE